MNLKARKPESDRDELHSPECGAAFPRDLELG